MLSEKAFEKGKIHSLRDGTSEFWRLGVNGEKWAGPRPLGGLYRKKKKKTKKNALSGLLTSRFWCHPRFRDVSWCVAVLTMEKVKAFALQTP